MDSNSPKVVYHLPPFYSLYSDGRVERFMGTETVPPSIDDPETPVQSKDVVVEPETGVSARLYKPRTVKPDQKLPLFVYFHGGGFFCQTAFSPTYQHFLKSVVAEAGAVVVSVDYRKAPEHPLPVAYEDSWAAVKWVASHAAGDGGERWLKDHADFDRVFFAGDSAGANIAHHMALRVGSEGLGEAKLVGITLMHPYFWGKDPIGAEAADMDRKARMDEFWLAACPLSSGLDDPMINPVLDPGLRDVGGSRILVFVCANDVMKDRGLSYCEALGKSGWGGIVELVETEGEDHVFHLLNPNSEKANDLVRKVVSFVKESKANSL